MSHLHFTEPFDEKDDDSSVQKSRTNSTTVPEPQQLSALQRRDSLASLSVARGDPRQYAGEPKWPSGWRPYVCIFGGFLLMFNSWGLVNAYGTYSSHYMTTLLPRQDLLKMNLVGSTQSFVVLIFSVVVGRLLDAGHIRKLICTGIILVVLGSFLLSVVNGDGGYGSGRYSLIWLTQGLITGLGMACFFVSSSQVVATWFRAKKGFVIGIVASGASIAGLVYPMMMRELIERVGFNEAQRYVAALTTATSIVALCIARPNPKHIVRTVDQWKNHREFIDTKAFRHWPFIWLTIGISFLFFGFYAVFFNLEEWAFLTGVGYRRDSSAESPKLQAGGMETYILLSIMNATSTVGRLSSAYLCDRWGALRVHTVVTMIGSILILALWTNSKTQTAATCFVVFFGIFSGAVIGLPPASMANVLGQNPVAQAKLGQWTGMMYSVSAVFALTGPIIAGHLITEFDNNFLTVQCWSGGCLFFAAICIGLAEFCRWRGEKRERPVSEGLETPSGPVSTTDGGTSRAISTAYMV